MTDPHDHDHGIQPAGHGIQHGATPGGVAAAFPYEEWLQFLRSDLGAGKVVVGLMAAIFSIGLVLYFAIAVICWGSSW
jgi:hypothetical protein